MKTIIVTGTEFSGTSLVAGVLRILGTPMGEAFYPKDTHQDKEFGIGRSDQDILETITRRNKDFKLWGLKQVNLSYWLDSALPYLRNPEFIVCCRSMQGCLSSSSKYKPDTSTLLSSHGREISYLAKLISSMKYRALMLDFSLSVEEKVEQISCFTGLTVTSESLKKIKAFDNGGSGYSVIN